MRIVLAIFFLAFALFVTLPALAGNIYGSLWTDGKPVPGVQIQINCPGSHPAQTDGNGAYSVFVPENGRCTFHVNFQGRSVDTPVASYGNPVKYDFDLVRQSDGSFTLRSR
jgi:hypothetical protein